MRQSTPIPGQICRVKCGHAWDTGNFEHFDVRLGSAIVVLCCRNDEGAGGDNDDVWACLFESGRIGYVSTSFIWSMS